MKKLIVIVLILSVAVILISCNDKKPAANELNKYTINVEVSDDLLSANLTTTILYYNNTGSDLNEIKLYLYPETYRKDSAACAYFSKLSVYGGITVNSVTVGGQNAEFRVESVLLTIKLSSALQNGGEIEITITAALAIPQSDLRFGLHNNVLKLANFYPVICVYENGKWRTDEFYKVGDPFYSDCADYEVTMRCPNDLVIASSGAISNEKTESARKTVTINAVSVRDFAIVASKEFKVSECIQGDTLIKYFYTGGKARDAELETGRKAIEVFSRTMLTYPYSVYSIVETDFYYGSASFGNLSIISKTASDKSKTIIHEVSHQWFGNAVGSDNVNNCWQHESLAAFMANYYYYLIGDIKEYDRLKDADKNEYVSFQTSQQKSKPAYDFSIDRNVYKFNTNYEYGMVICKKGSLMFDAVLAVVGKEKMNKALKSYYETYAYTNADPDKMIAVFNKATKQDVKAIFDSWLYGKIMIAGLIESRPPSEV